jgi:hypothetical protein
LSIADLPLLIISANPFLLSIIPTSVKTDWSNLRVNRNW